MAVTRRLAMAETLQEPVFEPDEEFDDLPDFANEANRELHSRYKAKQRELATVEEELSENKERIEVMQQHLKSVVTEQQHTQQLVDAKIKEIETEDHLKQLAERERGRFASEYKRLTAELAEVSEKITATQTAIFKNNEKMDQFKLQMNWNQEELEQWALAARQKEEDNLALLKYTKADEAKVKDLNLQLEKMLAAVGAKKAELDAEITETQAKQIELDKTAEDFKNLHRERNELVQQWEVPRPPPRPLRPHPPPPPPSPRPPRRARSPRQAAVQAMQKRDEAIQRAHEDFLSAKRDLKERAGALREKEEFLKTEVREMPPRFCRDAAGMPPR